MRNVTSGLTNLLTRITNCDINIAICNTGIRRLRMQRSMKLADKIRYLREVEGNLRGLGRAMTQQELVRAIQEEAGAGKTRGEASASRIFRRSRAERVRI